MPPFRPPLGVARAAERALEVREAAPPSRRGLTPVGLARARDLSNRRNVSIATLRRMLGYLSRHLVDKQGETWSERGKGWVAWHAWGGDAGGRWAIRELRRYDAEWFEVWSRGPRNRALMRHLRREST
jgi:hypothetical protein